MNADKFLIEYDLRRAINDLGYRISASPVVGEEVEFWTEVKQSLNKLETQLSMMKGTRKNKIKMLHKTMPSPSFVVEKA